MLGEVKRQLSVAGGPQVPVLAVASQLSDKVQACVSITGGCKVKRVLREL